MLPSSTTNLPRAAMLPSEYRTPNLTISLKEMAAWINMPCKNDWLTLQSTHRD